MMPNVLVTGGAGYIGSHACKALAAAGYQPVTVDNLCLGHRDFVKWGPLIEADIRNTGAVVKAISDHKPVGVMHFAGFGCVPESVMSPAKYYDNNVTGTLSILEAMRQLDLKTLVFSSSCAVYGKPNIDKISEQVAPQPVNPYGQSKLFCETMAADFAGAYGLRTIALRYFNASGADPDGVIGEKRPVETHLIPRAMMALQGHVTDFEVCGDDFNTEDGTAVRDYIHVSDLADAHVSALTRLLDGAASGAFNLGAGRGYSVREVLAMISLVSGRLMEAPAGPRRPGDPDILVADPRLARTVLGFQPRESNLRTIVESAWGWHIRAHPVRAH